MRSASSLSSRETQSARRALAGGPSSSLDTVEVVADAAMRLIAKRTARMIVAGELPECGI